MKYSALIIIMALIISGCNEGIKQPERPVFVPPVSYEVASTWADSIVNLMTLRPDFFH
jgi:hypothetical protein